MVVQGLCREKSAQDTWMGSEGSSWYNHEAVNVGHLEENMESRPVVKPKFTTHFLEAVVREGTDELTLRREEESVLRTFVDTTKSGRQKR